MNDKYKTKNLLIHHRIKRPFSLKHRSIKLGLSITYRLKLLDAVFNFACRLSFILYDITYKMLNVISKLKYIL